MSVRRRESRSSYKINKIIRIRKKMNKKLYVGGLSYSTTEDALKDAFSAAGAVESATIIIDKMSGRSKGFGFVEMSVQSQAQTAIKSLHGKELMGKQISVSEARPRPDQGRTGGGRMDYTGRRNRY